MATPKQGARPATTKNSKAKPAVKKKAAGVAAPLGRPTAYREEYSDWALKLAKLGATDKDLAEAFEVTEQTVNTWKKVHPDFFESIKKGKTRADAEVASKLFHRATGYEHPENDIKSVNGEIVITPTIKHYPPDTTAAIFWLKNRRPDLWRDKFEQEHSGPGGGAMQVQSTVTFVQAPARNEGDQE
ncbi:helix-turn-helix domain-containing protein [Comamonas odontotermitis]|uniref:helix-turn-helix domain-containing protein n=1 Tax=Comamonas TaxID=283 RepID=UPI00375187D9